MTTSIPLINDRHVMLVDDADAQIIRDFGPWHIVIDRSNYYAATGVSQKKCEKFPQFGIMKTIIAAHRFLMLPIEPGLQVDHINGIGLDNRRSNLRTCTHADNTRNRRLGANNTTGYKGVVRSQSKIERYISSIWFENKSYYLGTFTDPIEAAHAYDQKALELFGEFARLNFGSL
jgi:hypothetical protein